VFRDLHRSAPHQGMIYVAMKSLRTPKLLWWKLPHDRPTAAGKLRTEVPTASPLPLQK
jgi:hypothetical protein